MKKNFVLAAVAATGLGFAGIQAHAQQSGSSVVPEGSCAIQVASRPNLVEVADFIGKLDSRFTSVKVYKATSGWYAITIGNVEVNMGQQYVNEYVSQGLIPADSVCVSDGKKYVTEVDWRNASSFTTDGTTSIIPDGSCAIIAASRQNLSEVKDFIGNLDSSLTNIQVFQSTNGWYAVSVGLAPIQQGRRSVENLVQQGLIPSDSLCSSGKMYVAEVDWQNDADTVKSEDSLSQSGDRGISFEDAVELHMVEFFYKKIFTKKDCPATPSLLTGKYEHGAQFCLGLLSKASIALENGVSVEQPEDSPYKSRRVRELFAVHDSYCNEERSVDGYSSGVRMYEELWTAAERQIREGNTEGAEFVMHGLGELSKTCRHYFKEFTLNKEFRPV